MAEHGFFLTTSASVCRIGEGEYIPLIANKIEQYQATMLNNSLVI